MIARDYFFMSLQVVVFQKENPAQYI